MADDIEFEFNQAAWEADQARWKADHPVEEWPLADWMASYEAEWRRSTLAFLKMVLEKYDDDPRAPAALDRLIAAARLAVS